MVGAKCRRQVGGDPLHPHIAAQEDGLGDNPASFPEVRSQKSLDDGFLGFSLDGNRQEDHGLPPKRFFCHICPSVRSCSSQAANSSGFK